MAKIQNPQNQYGKNLATTEYLNSVKDELTNKLNDVYDDLYNSFFPDLDTHINNTEIHVDDEQVVRWDTVAEDAIREIKTDESTELLSVSRDDATVTISLSPEVATQEYVDTAKEHAINNAKVTISSDNGSGIDLSPNGSPSNTFEVTVDDTIVNKDTLFYCVNDLASSISMDYPTSFSDAQKIDKSNCGGFVIKPSKNIILTELECYLSPVEASAGNGNYITLNIFEYTFNKNYANQCKGIYKASSEAIYYESDLCNVDSPGIDEKYKKTFKFNSIFLSQDKLYAICWSAQTPTKKFSARFTGVGATLYKHEYNNTSNDAIGAIGSQGGIYTYSTNLIPYYKLNGNIYDTSSLESQIVTKADAEDVTALEAAISGAAITSLSTIGDAVSVSKNEVAAASETEFSGQSWTIAVDTYTTEKIDSDLGSINDSLTDHSSNNTIHNRAVLNNYFDKADDIKSYLEGTITRVDGEGNETTETLDFNDTVLAQGAFRTSSGKTSLLTSFNERPELIDENGALTSNIWYDKNDASLFDYEMDANAHSVAQNESSSLGSLINGSWMFVRSGLTMFNDDLNCLMNGTGMFYNSTSLNRFKSALPSLTVGQWMFKDCVSLKEFRVKLPALSIAQGMFAKDSGLTSFRSTLPNLTVAIDMFLNCTSLKSFIVPPSSLSNLYYARTMFLGCPLEDFTGSLEAIEQPQYMFYGCKLSLDSLNRIADTVKDCTGIYKEDDRPKTFGTIGINCTESEYDSSEFKTAIDKIKSKGWSCSVAFNADEVSTIGEDDITPVRLIYVQKENLGDSINDYIDTDGNKWTLIIAHNVSDPENWNIFSDETEAAEAFGLTKI